jgi:hypothetical protein
VSRSWKRHDYIDIDREALRPTVSAEVEMSLNWIVEEVVVGEKIVSAEHSRSSEGGVSGASDFPGQTERLLIRGSSAQANQRGGDILISCAPRLIEKCGEDGYQTP